MVPNEVMESLKLQCEQTNARNIQLKTDLENKVQENNDLIKKQKQMDKKYTNEL